MSDDQDFCYIHPDVPTYGRVLVMRCTPNIGGDTRSELSVIFNAGGLRFDVGYAGSRRKINADYGLLRNQTQVQSYIDTAFENLSKSDEFQGESDHAIN